MEFVYVAVGFVFGLLTAAICRSLTKNDGILRIDQSNPEKDIYRLKIDNLDILPRKKKIVLKVIKNDHTQF